MHHDPLKVVYEALERHDCDPTGPPHDARARCPAHEGDNRQALKLSQGADGRALLFCWAQQCDVYDIVRALGLQWGDLFPDGHRHAPKDRPRDVDATEAVVTALKRAGIGVRGVVGDDRFYIADRCPACGARLMWLHRLSRREVQMACASGCSYEEIHEAVKSQAARA